MTQIDFEKEELRASLQGSLLEFTRFFFPIITGRQFIVSNPVGRESHQITISRELTKAFRLEIPEQRLIINVPPGSGKSVMVSMWVAWTLSQYPDSNFLYISYSKTLAAKHTAFIKTLIASKEYKYLFDVGLRDDSRAKDLFKTKQGGSVGAYGSAGSITGQDAGLPNLDRFSGAIICFPYNEVVHTEQGLIKIGDIVKNKLNVNVYSFNLQTNKIELKPIQGWYENPESDIVEIILSDGTKFECTPNHHIYTQNRGWVEAKNLLATDKLLTPIKNSSLANSEQLSRFSLSDTCIKDYLFFIICERITLAQYFSDRLQCSFFFSFMGSDSPSSDFVNCIRMNIIFFGYYFIMIGRQKNIFNILTTQFATGMPGTHRESAMFNGIFHIIAFSAIAQIFSSIIISNTVNMSNFLISRLLTQKCPSNKTMDKIRFGDMVFSQCSSIVTAFIFSQFFYIWLLDSMGTMITIINNSFIGSNLPATRNTIKTIEIRDVSPLFVNYVRHDKNTYCINVKDNHNFFVGKSEDLGNLVSNCDDMHKPDEASSDTMREGVIENYRETIQQRARGIKVPFIFIGQRLHEADLAQYLLDGKDGHTWERVIIEAIDGAGNSFYPEVYPANELAIKQERDPYVYASQFQQTPVPAGGAVYKPEDFVHLDFEPKFIKTFITADTAETDKSWNDATVFSFWGLYEIETFGRKTGQLALHWIDCMEIRVEPKDLKDAFLDFYADCSRHLSPPLMAAIEKKSTGTTLVSVLGELRGLSIRQIERTRASGSKTQRFLECQPYVAGKLISFTRGAKHSTQCITHMSKITANDTHRHDDIADTLADAIKIGLIEKTLHNIDNSSTNSKKILNSLGSSLQRKLDAGAIRNARIGKKTY